MAHPTAYRTTGRRASRGPRPGTERSAQRRINPITDTNVLIGIGVVAALGIVVTLLKLVKAAPLGPEPAFDWSRTPSPSTVPSGGT